MAGYSGTPLPKKLGMKPGHGALLLKAPRGFADELAPLPEGARAVARASGAKRYDVVLAFCASRRDLDALLPRAVERLAADGGLWLCWIKRSAGIPTDIGEADIRAAGLGTGLVDVKICAVNDTWSGLRFVVRTKDRAAWPR